MEYISAFIDFVLHIDIHLDYIIGYAGVYTYLVLFGIIFLETGFVVTPFLPGDSLLFAVGAFCARGSLDVTVILLGLSAAAIIGDTVNYWVGAKFGQKMVQSKRIKLVKQKHIDKTHAFFEKHGGKTIILARFVPIVRTFAPFVAGMGQMTYRHFILYNVSGAIIWVFLFVAAGYFFGNQPFVKRNFSVVALAIIFLSVLPILIEVILHYKRQRNQSEKDV